MSEENPSVSAFSTIELIRVLNLSVISLGVKKVILLLKLFTENKSKDNSDIVEIIIYSVCSKFKITLKELVNSKRTDNDKHNAMCLISYLLKKHALMINKDIAKLLGRHKSQVSKYIARISRLNTELYSDDRKLKNYCTEIDDSLQILIHNEQTKIWKRKKEEGDQRK